jgi:activator of 2-hydroxyglutaryl-CoA dehydratase
MSQDLSPKPPDLWKTDPSPTLAAGVDVGSAVIKMVIMEAGAPPAVN